MRVLHYTLGLPPYRTGGLTKYTYDLMLEQEKNEYDVYLLFPGQMIKNSNLEIKHYKNINGIKTYEIINPSPVPLLNGVINPKLYMEKVDYKIYKKFLEEINVDVINIHTLMGIHIEFIMAAKKLNIPVMYTTHDYYGLCTKVNFLDNHGEICEFRSLERCVKCNSKGFDLKTIQILQSKQYRALKNIGAIDLLKSILSKIKSIKKNDEYKNEINNDVISENQMEDFSKLLNYYEDIFKYIDLFIFNSNITKEVYSQYLNANGVVTSITHKEIKDNRIKRNYNNKSLKLLYLGPSKSYKGFNLICDVMEELSGYNHIELDMYGNLDKNISVPSNVKIKGKYKYNQLETIFSSADVLVVPSIWKETFGFITLEAISYGIPVIVTENVGSKDIVDLDMENGIIVEPNKESLKETIAEIYENRKILEQINDNILSNKFNYSLVNHFGDIDRLYKSYIDKYQL